jgi:hypothetical protein
VALPVSWLLPLASSSELSLLLLALLSVLVLSPDLLPLALSSSRFVVSRPLTLLATRRTSMVSHCPVLSFSFSFGLASGSIGTKITDLYLTERADWPQEKLLEYFKNDTLALIGYGSQGHGQGLNLRDNGLNVIVGVRKNGKSWKDAEQDGWVAGKNLFDVDEAISRGTIVMNLLSDAAQSETWPAIKPQLVEGKVSTITHCLQLKTKF